MTEYAWIDRDGTERLRGTIDPAPGGSLPVAAGASGNVGDVVGVVYQTPGVFVVGGVDDATPLNGNGAVLTDAYAQWNGNGAGVYWSGNGTDGEQSYVVRNDAGTTTLHDADGNMSPAGTVIDLPDPTNPQEAATKAYADTKIAQGGTLTQDLDAGSNDLVNVATVEGAGPTNAVVISSQNANSVQVSSAGVVLGLNNTAVLGFFGHAPAAQPTGVPVDAAGIHAALVALGLITA